MKWDTLADDEKIKRTVDALKSNNIGAIVVETREEAKKMLLAMIPEGSRVYLGASTTLNQIGVTAILEESGKYDSGREKVAAISDQKERAKERKLQTVADYTVGSVQAVTEDGFTAIASASGSQLPSYAFNADNVIWVAGTQKIVKNTGEALQRIEEYCVPLENERAKKAYGSGTSLNKILIVRKDYPGRIRMILVKETLGF